MREPAPRNRPRLARTKSFAAPVGGWIANQNIAAPDTRTPGGGAAPQGATILENWFPTATGARMRGGCLLSATVGSGVLSIPSIFSYINGTNKKLFAATLDSIYDITSPADPAVSPAALVTGKTGGDWISVQYSTPGGTFLRLVNGQDDPLIYDGANFIAPNYSDPSTFPISGTGLDPKKLAYTWLFKSRLFFIERGTTNAWYLDVDVIGGNATIFPLGGVFQLGGTLLFGASWSVDQSTGLAAMCVFVSTEGEVAVYQGSNPGSADDWSLVGIYRIGRPLGPNAFIRAGGDLLIATDIGAIPLSQAANRDRAALAPAAVSYPIETEWNKEVFDRTSGPWCCEIWPSRQMVLVAMPSSAEYKPQIFAANARTGAWCKFTAWDALCLCVFGDRLYFGSKNGKIFEADAGGYDDSLPYTATYVPLFDDLRSGASLKTVGLARAVLLVPSLVYDQISVQVNYSVNLPAVPDSSPIGVTNLWGSGIWGTSVWGVERELSIQEEWRSVYGLGYALAPAIQITSGSLSPPDVNIVRIDMTYDQGDIVT